MFLIPFNKLNSQPVVYDNDIYEAPYGSGASAWNSVWNIRLDKYGRIYLSSRTYYGIPSQCCQSYAVKIDFWSNNDVYSLAGIGEIDAFINHKSSMYYWDSEVHAFMRKSPGGFSGPFSGPIYPKAFVDINDNLFASNGDSLYKFDSTGVIVSAFDIDVDYITGDELNNLYIVTDSLKKYNSSGTVLWSFSNNGNTILVDSIGNVYSFDSSSFTKLNPAGNIDFIRTGLPFGILAVDRLNNIYIATTNYVYKYNVTADTLLWSYPLTNVYSAISVDAQQFCYLARAENGLNDSKAYLKILRTLPPPDSIIITQVSDSVFCSGDSIEVHFNFVGNPNYFNYYNLELSDSSGSFMSGVSVLKTGRSSPLKAIIPTYKKASAHYRIRVVPLVANSGVNNNSIPIIVNKPNLNFSISSNYTMCSNYPPVDINPQPSGGILSGQGVFGTTFYPDSVSSPGSYQIVYNFTDSNGCSATEYANISLLLNPISSVALFTSSDSICKGDTLQLNGIPVGGIYGGMGLTNNIFYSDSTSMIDNLVEYSIVSIVSNFACTTSTTKYLHVFPKDSIVFILPHDTICPMEPPFLISATPGGGVLSGNALFGQTFYPDSAVVLAFNPINYTYTNAFGCENNATDSVYVFDSPILSIIKAVDSLCINESIILEGIPAGGYFSGQGMTDSTFIAINGTAGQNNITYNYSNSFGCENSISTALYVYPAVAINFNLATDTVCLNTPPFIINVSPPGGILSGDGIVGNIFYPDSIGAGLSSIYYTILSNDGCTYQSVDTIYVDYCLSSPYMDGSVQTIKIFPNPVSEVITIKSSSSLKNAIIQILDSNGRSVYEGNFSGTLETVNVSKLVEGLYLFKILDKSKPIFSEKISVLRR